MVLLEFFIDIRPQYSPGVDSASNRNEYQEYFLGSKGGRWLRLTTLPLSCADSLEIWKPQTPGTLRASPGLYWDCFTLTILELYRIFPHYLINSTNFRKWLLNMKCAF